MSSHLFTSESVTEGHPDKVCDKIADAILDDIIGHDPQARVACEAVATTGMVLVMGEISTDHYCNVPGVARDTLARIGYDSAQGFSSSSCAVLVSIDEQSSDIWQGVGESVEARKGSDDPLDALGAGDQGIMFGYACSESELVAPGSYMPLPIHLAHTLARLMAEARQSDKLPMLMPDGKTQVTVGYEGFTPRAVQTVVISTQHVPDIGAERLRRDVFEHILQPAVPTSLCPGGAHQNIEFLCNPTGKFVIGGPEADSGLTGRKVIVDSYGGTARHGGGAYSGKDPSKVDRSASYYARYVAKNLVAAGVAERLELQVSYAIARARPISLATETFGTEKVESERILQMLNSGEFFDFRPQAIINQLDLLRPIYEQTAAYGHFGRTDLDLPWERLDKVDAIRQALKL
jgi:S-adenosylmethionine synthetase